MIVFGPGLVSVGIILLVVVLLVITMVSYNRDELEGEAEVETLEERAMKDESHNE